VRQSRISSEAATESAVGQRRTSKEKRTRRRERRHIPFWTCSEKSTGSATSGSVSGCSSVSNRECRGESAVRQRRISSGAEASQQEEEDKKTRENQQRNSPEEPPISASATSIVAAMMVAAVALVDVAGFLADPACTNNMIRQPVQSAHLSTGGRRLFV
jgi:hypothetical protein